MSGAVVVMARAPRPGRCKTRLQGLLGPDGCAELQAALVRHTLDVARASPRATILAFDPPDARAELARLAPGGVELSPQVEGSLGDRLTHAAAAAFERSAAPVILLGVDAPTLGPGRLAAVDAALAAGADACLVPATDGGYALLALAARVDAAFALPAEAWGGPHVLTLTLAALRGAGLRIRLLEPVDDLDTPDDARRLVRDPACPPALRAVLAPYAELAE